MAVAAALCVAFASLPSSASEIDDAREELEELDRQREELEAQQADQAATVEAATAETEQLAEALEYWNREVNQTESALETAQARLAAAEAEYAKAEAEVTLAEARASNLERKVAQRAINAFVGRDVGAVATVNSREPKEATRMRTMVGEVTDQDFDVAEDLRATREDLAVSEAQAAAARAEADNQRARIEEELARVAEARDRQAELAAAAEDRLDHELYEQALMEEQGQQIDEDRKALNDKIAKLVEAQRAREREAARQASSSGSITYPSRDEIVKVRGFWVHEDIADNLDNMLAAAEAEGHNFGGWGYRDHQSQIRLRKAHCGTSDWAIYHMPSSQCSPPTARPGRSMHEQGKAIDFTYNGRSIGTRASAGYKWLAANAAQYGFYNLPSEPWHWSTNGN